LGLEKKCKAVSQYAKEKGIDISESGVRLIMEKWETNKYFINLINLFLRFPIQLKLQFLTKRKSW
jgi:hypothetical protein